ncbi:MAG: thioredoxin family protein [Leptospiraceae bacterium]|jgi:glutaredoxin-like protein|nr:thioredoxin family protein [Leptospiraceae bacterium]
MKLLNADTQKEVQSILQEMKDPVKMILFVKNEDCIYCKETQQLLEEVKELNDKISLEVYNIDFAKEKAEYYNIDKAPAIILENGSDFGIRFYGIPSGYEFGTLLQDLIYVSKKETELSPSTKDFIKKINKPLHIQVFVTPTCPYCPRAVLMAHQMALESEFITADMIEATEFPDLANKYRVYGVPKIVVNEVVQIEGAVPESTFINKIKPLLN